MESGTIAIVEQITNIYDMFDGIFTWLKEPWFYIVILLLLVGWGVIASILDVKVFDRTVNEELDRKHKIGYGVRSFFGRFVSFCKTVFLQLPSIIGVFLVLFIVSTGFGLINEMGKYFASLKELEELTKVVRRLEDAPTIAEMEIVEKDDQSVTAEIIFRKHDREDHVQTVTVPGDIIYFEATVLNFDYKFVKTGEAINLAIPTAVYSNQLPQREAIALESTDEDGIPWSYKLPEEEIYGISTETFFHHINNVSLYFKDKEAAREAGLRSINTNAVAENLRVGDVRAITVQNTGGMTIQPIRKTW